MYPGGEAVRSEGGGAVAGAGRVVVALGGNAILQPGQSGTATEQVENIRTACRQIAQMAVQGWQLVLTHGNGPQVGNRLIQNAGAEPAVPAMPLDVCVAETQGQLGYWFQQLLQHELRRAGRPQTVVSLVTQVVVAAGDPAFQQPSKPVGPFFAADQARDLASRRGWHMAEDAGRGWRRTVASPHPSRIVELPAIRLLLDGGALVIAAGGGGVPVAEGPNGLYGVEAVIDKDLAAQLLAQELQADALLFLTDVRHLMLHYGRPGQRELHRLTVREAERYLAEGHFPAGSMGRKVRAAADHLRAGGRRAVICHLEEAALALAGRAGTQFLA